MDGSRDSSEIGVKKNRLQRNVSGEELLENLPEWGCLMLV